MLRTIVTESTDQDRQRETEELYQQIKPYIDNGYSLSKALHKIGRFPQGRKDWYKRLREYTIEQGYVLRTRKR